MHCSHAFILCEEAIEVQSIETFPEVILPDSDLPGINVIQKVLSTEEIFEFLIKNKRRMTVKKWVQFSLVICAFVFSVSSFASVKVVAHRGGSMLAPENTLAAFNNAISLNVDYIELDVQLSSDDSLMIMHDLTVDRTTNGTGTVRSKTYAQLRALDAGSKFSLAYAGEKIPTLSEVFAAIKNSGNTTIGLAPEFKSSESNVIQLVVAEVQKWNLQSRVVLSSFNLSQLVSVKNLDPTIRVQVYGSATNSMIDGLKAMGGEWIGSDVTTQPLVDYAHTNGIIFNSWTINSANQMVSLMALGVDGIISDDPKTLIAVSDTSAPSNVVVNSALATGETDITLDWQPSTDPESGISGYEIYRDVNPNPTTLYTTVGDTTSYVDHTLVELQPFYYRLKAVNGAGIKSANYSNEVSTTTGTDVTKPVVAYVTSSGDTSTVVVEFSERVDQTTAETVGNYTINKSVSVLNAKLALDQKQIILTTTQMLDTTYTLTVKNVKDKAITPNVMTTSSTIFWHKNNSSDIVAYYKLDETQIVGSDTLIYDASPNANNGILKNEPVVASGFLGNALQFDGVDDYVQFSPSPTFDMPGGVVSLSVWTKLNLLPSQLPGAFGPIFDSETDQYVIYEDRGNNQLRFKVTTTGGAARPAIQVADLKTGEWINVVGVYDGANAKIYLNGVLKGTLPLTGTVNPGQAATLGKSGTTFFSGEIDNVKVFNRALTAQEVADLYTQSKTIGVSPNPSDVTLNAPVVNETDVTLSWTPSVTYESTMMGYEIYRDVTPLATTLIATVDRNQTAFVDNTGTENQTFHYRVRAKNSLALFSLNYSNEVTATTTTDTQAPIAAYITSREKNTKVVVEFNELVDEVSSENISNYSINNEISIISAQLCLDGKTVILKTSTMSVGSYYLTLNNIQDRAVVPNSVIPFSYYLFNHTGFPSNLIAYYSMDETRVDTLVDASINGNNGVFMNGTTIDKGHSGNSLVFNGVDNYVQFAASPSFDITSGVVSVSAWVKLDYLPTEMTMAYGPIFDSQGDQYVIYEDKGNKEFRFKATTLGGAARPGITQADLITGQWINVVGVYNGTNAMVYLNGVRKGILPLTGTILPGQVAMLGKSGTAGTPAFLKGNIDYVAVFDKALSDAEILEMYNNYKVPVDIIVPVELTSFNAVSSKNDISLTWETATETNNQGYEIQRSSNKINFVKIGFIKGAGTSTEKHTYSFIDDNPTANRVFYRLKQIDFDGTFWYSHIVEATNVIPTEFALSQNYPNPFNPVTTIDFQLPVTTKVLLKVFDILGNEVATLVDEVKEAGYYELSFNGSGLASGTYFFRLQSGNFVKINKMILLK